MKHPAPVVYADAPIEPPLVYAPVAKPKLSAREKYLRRQGRQS